MYTYEEKRQGLSYFYCKRKVSADGVHTSPLAITLSPWGESKVDIIDDTHPWSLTTPRDLHINGRQYSSLSAVCMEAETMDKPKEFVQKCFDQLPHYQPSGRLMVALTKKLKKEGWEKETYWTTGLSPKASPLRANLPGQNILGTLFYEVLILPLRDHDYINE